MLRRLLSAVVLTMMAVALAEGARGQTADDVRQLGQTIRQCVQSKWKVVVYGKGEPLPTIKMRLHLKPDGTLATAPIILDPQASRLFVTASNRAAMAVQACAPFRLPPAQYEVWKEMVLTLDPRDTADARGTGPASPSERREGIARGPGITRSAANDAFGRAVERAMRETMPRSGGPGRVTIKLILLESGRLQEVHLVVGSGDSGLDTTVLSAAKEARFPKPPAGATLVDRTFVVTYLYR